MGFSLKNGNSYLTIKYDLGDDKDKQSYLVQVKNLVKLDGSNIKSWVSTLIKKINNMTKDYTETYSVKPEDISMEDYRMWMTLYILNPEGIYNYNNKNIFNYKINLNEPTDEGIDSELDLLLDFDYELNSGNPNYTPSGNYQKSNNSVQFYFNNIPSNGSNSNLGSVPPLNGDSVLSSETDVKSITLMGLNSGGGTKINKNLIKNYSVEVSYNSWVVNGAYGNFKKFNPEKNNGWSRCLYLHIPFTGYNSKGKPNPKTLDNIELYYLDIGLTDVLNKLPKDLLNRFKSLVKGISNSILMKKGNIIYGNKTLIETIEPEIILPNSNDSKYFYYGNAKQVLSIQYWFVSDSDGNHAYEPGKTIKLKENIIALPEYNYNFTVDAKGDIPGSEALEYPIIKEFENNKNFKPSSWGKYEWYSNDGVKGIDKFNKHFMLPDLKQTGWIFKGWKLYNGEIVDSLTGDNTWDYNKHLNIRAEWERESYKVNYVLLVPKDKSGDTNGKTYSINGVQYSEVDFVDQNTNIHFPKIEESFESCSNYSLISEDKIKSKLKGYIYRDNNLYVLNQNNTSWIKDDSNPYKLGQLVSTANASIKTFGDVTLGLIVDPEVYTITFERPLYKAIENGSVVWKSLDGVDFNPKMEQKFTILTLKKLVSSSEELYGDSNTLYPISRGYNFEYNEIRTKSGKKIEQSKIELYSVFEDLIIKSYFNKAKYKFRYYDYCYNDYIDTDIFDYNALISSKSNYPLSIYLPNGKSYRNPESEFYRFDNWSNKKLGIAFITDDDQGLFIKPDNLSYFYTENGNIYLRIPQNSDEEINIIELRSDWTRFSGPEIYKSNEWHWPVNYQGNNEKDEDGNYYDAIKVFDKDGWHQAIKVFIRDEEKWNDLNIKSPHTTFEEI